LVSHKDDKDGLCMSATDDNHCTCACACIWCAWW